MKRIDLAGKLIGHDGCVNTIEFNYCGDHLVSGSDDRRVIFWNVATTSLVLSYASGHVENIFQARIMPFSDDRTIVTSAADGQVSFVCKCYSIFPSNRTYYSFDHLIICVTNQFHTSCNKTDSKG